MLKRRLIPMLIVLVPPCLVLAVLLAQRSISAAEASDLYRRYEHNEHISATFLKAFPVDDTLRVDVTLLQATDSAGWETLRTSFNVVDVDTETMQIMEENRAPIIVKVSRQDSIVALPDTNDYSNNIVLAIDFKNKYIGIFHTKTKDEILQVCFYNYNLNITHKKIEQ